MNKMLQDMIKKIKVIQGDITKLPMKVDAIVNAANSSLLGGGGVDGAIHRVAGPQLLAECKKLHGCKTGQAKLTKAYNLNTDYVIHTVGPKYDNYFDKTSARTDLVQCYKSILNLVTKYNIKTIAIPSISTGIYHFPLEDAARLAMGTLKNEILDNDKFKDLKIYFVCFDDITYLKYVEAELRIAANDYLCFTNDDYDIMLQYLNNSILLEARFDYLDQVLAYYDMKKKEQRRGSHSW